MPPSNAPGNAFHVDTADITASTKLDVIQGTGGRPRRSQCLGTRGVLIALGHKRAVSVSIMPIWALCSGLSSGAARATSGSAKAVRFCAVGGANGVLSMPRGAQSKKRVPLRTSAAASACQRST
jgi:hypothetical protein